MLKCSLLAFFAASSCLFAADPSFAEEELKKVVADVENNDWYSAQNRSLALIQSQENTSPVHEAYYYLGISYYHIRDFEFANDYLTKYLETASAASHFEDALLYKIAVAEEFRLGQKKRIFKWQKAPNFLSAMEDALEIYDQIIASLPFSELAASSFYGKAKVHTYFEEYKEAIRAYHTLTQKFSKHELAIEGYVEMAKIYLAQCVQEHLDPDVLENAETNSRKFAAAFPGEERICEVNALLGKVKEAFAKNLYETGRFYERTYKPSAAAIYYRKALMKFPKTESAKKCKSRLASIQS